jgi:hypothetical protein
MLNLIISIALGLTLSAACGFRVFVPPLVLSLAAHFGQFQLPPRLHWLGSDLALIALVTAAIVETFSFAIPGFNHLLDAVATPVAMAMGILILTSSTTNPDGYGRRFQSGCWA